MFNSKTNRYYGIGGFAGLPLGTDLKTENGFLQESEPLFWAPQIGVFGTGSGYAPYLGDGDYPNPKPTRPGVKPIGIPDDPPENSAPGDIDKGGGDNDSQPNPASGSDEDKTPVNDTTPETSAPQIGNDEDTDNGSNGAPEKTAEIDDGHERNTTPHHGRTDTPNTGKDKNAAPEVGNIDNTVIEPVVTSSPAEPGTIAENAISVNRDTLLEKKFFDSTSVNNPYPEKPSVMDGYEFSPSAESIAKKKAENEFLGKHMVPDGYAGAYLTPERMQPQYFEQQMFTTDKGFGENFGSHACFATSILNELSEEYTKSTGKQLTDDDAVMMMKYAVESGGVLDTKSHWAYVKDPEKAANGMWKVTGLCGNWTYEKVDNYVPDAKHAVYGVGHSEVKHFVNSTGIYMDENKYEIFDVWDGQKKIIKNKIDGYDNRKILTTRLFTFEPVKQIENKKRSTVYIQDVSNNLK